MAGCFRFGKEENTMTWRIVHVCQSEKMQLKLDNLLIKKMGQDYVIPLSDISIIVAEVGEHHDHHRYYRGVQSFS